MGCASHKAIHISMHSQDRNEATRDAMRFTHITMQCDLISIRFDSDMITFISLVQIDSKS